MNATWAKAFGWLQFLSTTVPTAVASGGGSLHTAQGIFGAISSLLLAIGVHAAASTDGSK